MEVIPQSLIPGHPGPVAERERERAAQRELMSRRRAEGRDVSLPAVGDPERREACRLDLRRYCLTYRRELFTLAMSELHDSVVLTIQEGILHGWQIALAAPRGFGKSTIVSVAQEWAAVFGHSLFEVIVTSETSLGESRLADLKQRLSTPSGAWLEDFPEFAIPLAELQGSPQRGRKQTVGGVFTHVVWGQSRVHLPTVRAPEGLILPDGSRVTAEMVRAWRDGAAGDADAPPVIPAPGSGAIIVSRSMESSIRGLVYDARRPDLVMVDDPQTAETARSEIQTASRLDILRKDIPGLVGPGKSLTIVMLCTIIRQGDIADEFTSGREPGYLGLRHKALTAEPTESKLMEEYSERVKRATEHGDASARSAHAWYIVNRERIERGAAAAWADNYVTADVGDHAIEALEAALPDLDDAARESVAAVRSMPDGESLLRQAEVSAVQAQLNKIARYGRAAWLSEYQNDPPEPDRAEITMLEVGVVLEKHAGLQRGVIPDDAVHLVIGRDVGRYAIHTVVAAVSPGRRVHVIDYHREHVPSPEGRVVPGARGSDELQMAIDAAILTRLRELRSFDLAATSPGGEAYGVDATQYRRADGSTVPVSLAGHDSRFGLDTVSRFCRDRESGHTYIPVMGMGSARSHGRSWSIPRGLKSGDTTPDGRCYTRHDNNLWRYYAHADAYKADVHAGFLLPADADGAFTLFEPSHIREHAVYADHITAEMEVEIQPGVTRWMPVKGRRENHYLDATYLCLVCCSILEHWDDRVGLAVTAAGLGKRPEKSAKTEQQPEQAVPAEAPRRRRVFKGVEL